MMQLALSITSGHCLAIASGAQLLQRVDDQADLTQVGNVTVSRQAPGGHVAS
jgi:hypothetical protein